LIPIRFMVTTRLFNCAARFALIGACLASLSELLAHTVL
jgi:hypothetical protein